MSLLLRTCPDKFLLALAVALMMFSGSWLYRQQAVVRRLHAPAGTVQLTGSRYEPVSPQPPGMEPAVWAEPLAQSTGRGWLYEVFTPPVIYFNPRAGSFAVTPPHNLVEGGIPPGLGLIEVKLKPYPLQLVGYFGGPGNYLAAFVSPDSPGTMLAREGHRFENLGLTLRSFTVGKVAVDHRDTWPVYEVAARAVLADEMTGADVVLDSRTRQLTGIRLAVFQLPVANARTAGLHEGDTFSAAGSTYRIERIQLDPPEVVVVRQTADRSHSETRTLRPITRQTGQVAGQSAGSKLIPASPPAGLATNDK
jgi:hypothetical protein